MDMRARYAEMHSKGLKALLSGNVNPFAGVDDSLRRRLIFASCFAVPAKVAELLHDLRSEDAFEFIVAGTDYPLHATLKQATAPGDVMWPEEMARSRLQACGAVKFDTLIFDGGNLILAASEVPDELVAARALLDGDLSGLGLEPLPLPILHMTLARMVRLPESLERKQGACQAYCEKMERWRDRLAEDPVVLDLEENVRMTSTYDLLTAPF